MNVLILAGAKPGQTNRARTLLAGRPMLDYVVAAIREATAETGGNLFVAGWEADLPDGVTGVAGGADMVSSLLKGIAALPPETHRVLVATADIPFLTGAATRDFLRRAQDFPDAEFLYSAVEAEICRKVFPGMKRTTLRLAEGELTGGNLVVLAPAFLRRREAILRDAWARRKSVAGLAKLLGAETIFRLLISRIAPAALTIAYLEKVVGRTLGGVPARLILSPYPEIAADCDREEDMLYAERWLTERLREKGQGTNAGL